MIDPFDAEFLSQELRDSWKKIEELEKENNRLKEEIVGRDDSIMYLEELNKELEDKLEFYKKNYNPYWAGEVDDE